MSVPAWRRRGKGIECVCREKERRESEERLQTELERLRQETRQEVEHTKSYTKELFDRENRSDHSDTKKKSNFYVYVPGR